MAAAALGVSKSEVSRARSGVPDGTPDAKVAGRDGKKYSAKKATKGRSPGLEKLQAKAEALGFQVRCKTPGDYALFNGDGSPAKDADGYEICFTNLADGRECLEKAAAAKASATPEQAPVETEPVISDGVEVQQ